MLVVPDVGVCCSRAEQAQGDDSDAIRAAIGVSAQARSTTPAKNRPAGRYMATRVTVTSWSDAVFAFTRCRQPELNRHCERLGSSPSELWVQSAPKTDTVATMSKVIQIRDVPDDVHDALAEAAEAQGLSLTRYMLRELKHLAKRAQVVRDNAAVIRETQASVLGRADRDVILTALHEGRND